MADRKPLGLSRAVAAPVGLDLGNLAGSPQSWVKARRRVSLLTPRQRQVLALVAGGLSNKEVARKLGCSPRTVEIHRRAILLKLECKSTLEAVRIAFHAAMAEFDREA